MIELTIILNIIGDKLICIILSFFMYFDDSIDWVKVVRDVKEKSWYEKLTWFGMKSLARSLRILMSN